MLLALLCGVASSCGGLLVPEDEPDGGAEGGVSDGGDSGSTLRDGNAPDARPDARPPIDAAIDAAIDAPIDATPPDVTAMDASEGDGCILDAAEDVPLCTPPSDDLLFASPAMISVAAGSYGSANFVATGPWSTDPGMYMHYEGSTLDVRNNPYVVSYGTPQSIQFLLPADAEGQTGTLTVSGHLGNIEQTAEVAITVTACIPLTHETVCGTSVCGGGPDGCGGQIVCGTCDGDTPYCFYGQCISAEPRNCVADYGFDPDAGQCLWCPSTDVCAACALPGFCTSIGDRCLCFTSP